MRQSVAQGVGIGEVATAFTGDAQFASGLVHLFQQEHTPTAFRCRTGSHQSCRTATNNDNIKFHIQSLDLRRDVDIVGRMDAKHGNLRFVHYLLGVGTQEDLRDNTVLLGIDDHEVGLDLVGIPQHRIAIV